MPGMSLKTGLSGSASYTPLTPASTTPAAAGNIGQKAFGINGSGSSMHGPRTAAIGSVGMGVAAMGLLVFIWYSLPR